MSSEPGNLLVTAGHCLYDPARREAVASFVFVPGYQRGASPSRIYAGSIAAIHPKFAGGDRGYDYAFVTVYGAGGKQLADVVGGQGLAWNDTGDKAVRVFGYKGAIDPRDRDTPRWCYGMPKLSTSGERALKCNLAPGIVGGPLTVGYNDDGRRAEYVGGVVSAFEDTDGDGRHDRVLSTFFNGETEEVYNRVARHTTAAL
ncbi:hypothetical protein AB0J63_24500 [Streptosporangium canum]|uniref:trypsin-like serine peptidase n=1 Tax=Streptosporangium canum TaxID=324952 RepID=UPI00342C2624